MIPPQTTFLPRQRVPASHPDPPPPSATGADYVRPGSLTTYLVHPDTRRRVDYGFNQLQELKLLLVACRARLLEAEQRGGGHFAAIPPPPFS